MPGTDLICRRHNQWLVTDETITLDLAPEVLVADTGLRRLRRRRGDKFVDGHYRRVYQHMTNDWRGTRWHRLLVQRWSTRQLRMHPAAHPHDKFVRSHTHHWSMLPETVAIIEFLARSRQPLLAVDDLGHALGLEHH